MKILNQLFSKLFLVCLFGTLFAISSCDKDDDGETNIGSSKAPDYLFGDTWIAETDNWYFYLTLSKNGTYEYQSESKRGSEGYGAGTFTYNSKSKIITCKGASGTVYNDGDVSSGSSTMQFEYRESEKLLKNINTNCYFSKGHSYDNREKSNVCSDCNGTGVCSHCTNGKCSNCLGSGTERDTYSGKYYTCRFCNGKKVCSYCGGTRTCLECNGTGR